MRSQHMFYACIISSILVIVTKAYDIGCIYPPGSPDPWNIRSMLSNYGTENFASGMETPQVIRGTWYWGNCQALCLHYHDPRVSDPYDFSMWEFPIPVFAQNAFSMIMCIAQCDAHYVASIGDTYLIDYIDWAEDELEFDLSMSAEALNEIETATMSYYDDGDKTALGELLAVNDYDPYLMGHIAGFHMMAIANDDGWNADGMLQYSPEENGAVPCTGSCRKYQDTTGYAPVPDPRTNPEYSDDDSKYDCTGLCRHWQPLQEGNPKGSLKRQDFVVPHIGTYGRTWLRDVTSDLEDPGYDLHQESLKVIDQLKRTSGDDYRKDMVDYFDDKVNARFMIRKEMERKYTYDIPFQDYALFVYGLSMVEYDSVVQAWHEKAIHDYVRPTTYIKHWDTDILETFGGDIDHDGPVNIPARDFEALIRVMPHGEFPSGSACLCTGYMEYTDTYTTRFQGDIITNIQIRNEIFSDMTEVRDVCSESRLWGGMHFEAAIPAGIQACEGLGELGVEYIVRMKDNSIPFEGTLHYRDGPRPRCGD